MDHKSVLIYCFCWQKMKLWNSDKHNHLKLHSDFYWITKISLGNTVSIYKEAVFIFIFPLSHILYVLNKKGANNNNKWLLIMTHPIQAPKMSI